MRNIKWHHAAAATSAVVAAVSVVLYFLLRDDRSKKSKSEQDESKKEDGKSKKLDIAKTTKEEVVEILQNIVKSQDDMRTVMKNLSADLASKDYTFEDVYWKVKKAEPVDPLEATGLTMLEFDALLEKFEEDENIQEIIRKIMGSPPDHQISEKIQNTTAQTISEIHKFMIEKIKELSEALTKMNCPGKFDYRTATIAAQAIISAEVEKKYKLSTDELECAIFYHHRQLAADESFTVANVSIQEAMANFMSIVEPSLMKPPSDLDIDEKSPLRVDKFEPESINKGH